MPRIAIIGGGPAGCIAAWACHLQGVAPTVYSDTRTPSALPGAQYLHSPFVLPGGRHIDHCEITYVKRGTPEGYARKIYGPDFDPAQTSWNKFPAGVIRGWPLREVYEMLHEFVQNYIHVTMVTRHDIIEMEQDYDLIFNSAPAPLFAMDGAEPKFEKVWVVIKDSGIRDARNIIVYEGESSKAHYRYSMLEGVESWEYPETFFGLAHCPAEAVEVRKPLSINKPPMSTRIVPIGRYGRWEKGVLVDSVFNQVSRIVEQWPK
jgi:hypothetical protein